MPVENIKKDQNKEDSVGEGNVKNKEIARIFLQIADILELQEDSFKPRAYRRAARTLERLDEDIEDIAIRQELEDIPGVGKALAKKIEEYLETGDIEYLHRLTSEIEPGLIEILNIPDVGPKTVRVLHQELGITSIDELRIALEEHRIQELSGFGPTSEDRIRQNLELMVGFSERMPIGDALPIAERLVADLQQLNEVTQIAIAGSLRRWKETIGDIDILVSSHKPLVVMQAFIEHPTVERILAQGPTKSSIHVKGGIQVDLRVVENESFGAALQYFTGSKAHNIALRSLARKRKWKLSEYHLLDTTNNKVIAGSTESAIYNALDMDWVPPELREDFGEVEAALQGNLPSLVQEHDIRGDLHVHSNWSDGADTIEDMAKAAIARKYEYLAICDHSKHVAAANGLDESRLRKQINHIHKLNKRLKKIHLLAGIEVDILPDGSLDLSDTVLSETDLVIAAIHLPSKTKKSITDLLIKACQHELVDAIAHPTGRILGQRTSFSIDFPNVFKVAKKYSVAFEINSSHRLDLSSKLSREAKEQGIGFMVNTDAHRASQLELIRYGVGLARRGWIEPSDVLNALPLDQLQKRLKHPH